jgi:hypothetical protein
MARSTIFVVAIDLVYNVASFVLDALVYLFAVDSDVLWCVDSDAHLISFDAQDGHASDFDDHAGFSDVSCEY